jgi:uncharacterized protein YndB with AHSA1/START domain
VGVTIKHDFLYSVEREVAVSIDTLWNAFTDTDALQAWYHPTMLNALAGATLSEAHVGGKWQCAIEVPMDGSVHCFYGRYTAVESKKYLEHTMHYTVNLDDFKARDENTPFHIVKIEFEDRGDNSFVRWAQYGEMPEAQIEMTRQGMSNYLDSLEQFLAN